MRPLLLSAITLALAAPCAQAQGLPDPVGRNAERGDPARWYEPADTPRKRHDTAMKEAVAAKAEALRECRAMPDRRRCEAEARQQYEADVQRARALLAGANQD